MPILVSLLVGFLLLLCPLLIGILLSLFIVIVFQRWKDKVWSPELEESRQKPAENEG